jgi:CubicO group peptidase (beta-lactamase class C family)
MQIMRIHQSLRILSFSTMLGTSGCTDDAPHGGDDEVGEDVGDSGDDISPIAVDPLEGDGANPPDADLPGSSTNPTHQWRSPSTLGNGLVHDSRLNLDSTPYQRVVLNVDLAEGIAWSGFVKSYEERARVGFRPAQVRAQVNVEPHGNSTTTIEIIDKTVYVADDDANYRTQIATYVFGSIEQEQEFDDFAPAAHGARPTSIDTFAVQDGTVGFSVAWVYDGADVPWMILAGHSESETSELLKQLSGAGYRPISIASRRRQDLTEYAAIVVQDGLPPSDWSVSMGIESPHIADDIQAKWAAGMYPFRGSGEHGSWSNFNLLWARRPPGISVQIRLNLDADTFKTEDVRWRSHGYHLESVGRYGEQGDDRLLAVWVRYEPYLRWQGTVFPADDPSYSTRYRMFHDQAIRSMSFATQIDCSNGQTCPAGTSCFECAGDTPCFHDDICVESKFRELLRPSSTLHVFEGPNLVLSRAYTFAPAIYEDTPLSASMKIASVSKSITAAAVVREMAAKGLPLTTPFNLAAGIAGAPPAMDAVSVLDVLRQLGGFMPNPVSYGDHALIDASYYGTIPISGQELFDYVVSGHLGVVGDDNYWKAMYFAESQQTGAIKYSNPGYSMLGELVRVLSGTPYEQYVVENLLVPEGLEEGIFSDPAHRIRASGVTLAGTRAYLVNGGHPYHVKPAQDAQQVGICNLSLGWAWNGIVCTHITCACQGTDCNELYADAGACEGDHTSPMFGAQSLPQATGVNGTVWRDNVGPLEPAAPNCASWSRYSGGYYMGGAPLAAGGWHGDGVALGKLMRALTQSDALLSSSTASSLWSPQWWNTNNSPAPNWSYGLGWYVRGNWVAWAGGAEGSMATVLHNRAYDFTVVHLANVTGNGLGDFMDPLMKPVGNVWNTSPIGSAFPCVDDPQTVPSECNGTTTTPY